MLYMQKSTLNSNIGHPCLCFIKRACFFQAFLLSQNIIVTVFQTILWAVSAEIT